MGFATYYRNRHVYVHTYIHTWTFYYKLFAKFYVSFTCFYYMFRPQISAILRELRAKHVASFTPNKKLSKKFCHTGTNGYMSNIITRKKNSFKFRYVYIFTIVTYLFTSHIFVYKLRICLQVTYLCTSHISV